MLPNVVCCNVNGILSREKFQRKITSENSKTLKNSNLQEGNISSGDICDLQLLILGLKPEATHLRFANPGFRSRSRFFKKRKNLDLKESQSLPRGFSELPV